MEGLKEQIINQLISILDEKLSHLNNHSKDLNDALSSETKSTAGDKHDTSRAMVHLEQEKVQHQFSSLQHQRYQLLSYLNSIPSDEVVAGSLIQTEHNTFLVGIGLGKQHLNGSIIYCIGAETPLAHQLLRKKVSDEFFFNGGMERIVGIW